MRSIYLFIMVMGLACLNSSARASLPFGNGDRWTMVGDSITHSGDYHTWIYLYCLTRFPGIDLEVANAGNSGDDAHGALERYDWDIAPKDATVASVMFGMNDVRREIYGNVPDSPQVRDQRIYILEGYRSFMNQLVERLEDDGVRLILMTPTIYDETAQHDTEVLTGVNGALGVCATYVGDLAKSSGATLVDFYGPMNAINAHIQSKDPSASLIKPDRVHPNEMGQFVMAYLFLKAVEAPSLVSHVSIDGNQLDVIECSNAQVTDLAKDATGFSFNLEEQALPFPVGREQLSALEWVPFHDDFNQQILTVIGLPKGEYRLLIDGKPIRIYESGELADGVNLALENNTPQAIQAAEGLRKMKAWHADSLRYRSIATFEFWNLGHMAQPVSLDAARQYLEPKIEAMESVDNGPMAWKRKSYERYLELKPDEQTLKASLAQDIAAVREFLHPQPHHYRLEVIQ